jgi:hypothetical protein
MNLDRNTPTFTGEGKAGSFANLDISDSASGTAKLPKITPGGAASSACRSASRDDGRLLPGGIACVEPGCIEASDAAELVEEFGHGSPALAIQVALFV